MNKRNRRNIILILQIIVEIAKLSDKKHSLVNDSSAGKRNNVGIIAGLLKNTTDDIEFAVKCKTLCHTRRTLQEALHDARHTVKCFGA